MVVWCAGAETVEYNNAKSGSGTTARRRRSAVWQDDGAWAGDRERRRRSHCSRADDGREGKGRYFVADDDTACKCRSRQQVVMWCYRPATWTVGVGTIMHRCSPILIVASVLRLGLVRLYLWGRLGFTLHPFGKDWPPAWHPKMFWRCKEVILTPKILLGQYNQWQIQELPDVCDLSHRVIWTLGKKVTCILSITFRQV